MVYVARRLLEDPGLAIRVGNTFKTFAVRPTLDGRFLLEVTVKGAEALAGRDLEKKLDILITKWRLQ